MKELVRHLLRNNINEILGKSIMHCHCRNVHSIMLLDCPEKTIRLYIATKGHELYRNYPDENMSMGKPMSVGLHSHHCNLTLHVIKGQLYNWQVVESPKGQEFNKYLYQSKISNGELKFQPLGTSRLETTQMDWIAKGESISMLANQIHTVSCYPNMSNAWMVYEGKKDESYKPYLWTNHDINQDDFSGLYQKMDKDTLFSLLDLVEL